jgi:cytochrome c oxidase subunit II
VIRTKRFIGVLAFAALAAAHFAGAGTGKEAPITNLFNEPATQLAHTVRSYWIYVVVVTGIFLVLPQALLLYCIAKFKDAPGRKPETFHDNLKLEIFWTVVPIFVLIVMSVPSYQIIKDIENPPPADVNIEIVGRQFLWEYRYPNHGDIRIADEPLVIPVGKNIVADCTSNDVLHAWWVPAFGVKTDTIPGRLTQIWFNVDREGWYKGQCAELCGALHSKMLIDVKVVSQEEFDAWVAEKTGGGTADEDAKAVVEAR